ncbi:hypothetical protein COY43_02570 [Candidatus Berkelbacteria bacterium CG_4_10_14_0_8_um_filter_35_9_33_8]|uniref:DNA-directed DNA polymerase n=1 Tax=Candidatus Berkelbacteria bacterium CG_4_10_14_0_2_um_filter_35_9_33_12 TaxID=1974499 RepID=A0A2M7W3Z2_9BACT|nr:MAG: hypothetical protein COX10_01570 [Candidatus Berkelbacteria bacterium CG23_combo_of_CG06-09_8_20_14_all_33_15]PIS08357.1 MAG: hypothetical protein COT76_01860 [Candidatus Berkelbacteria bacterium CG10_big_fil_rev_8_21_14_0_10_33_10]PIZ28052.1 MAG: hypothetical protein COY43_02570 [Candidatus Berkelbacteria bacterium CG_4_10_14_0_8_um_filter_35_9_33_8]PJA20343.1 MAG: hypothetical protein COX60_01960 [Candidatus Berkelbacteria bacterium CG_4_10_14_0_2_um_filter_35_9_33_12]PJB51569.1 MAG: 
MKNIIIIEALDKYFADLFIKELKQKYLQKYSDGLVKIIDSPEKLLYNNLGQSLFENQKLLLINLPLSDWEKLLIQDKKLLENNCNDWVIAISEKLKKSSKLYKKTQKNPILIIKTIAEKSRLELEKHFIQKYNFESNWYKNNCRKIIDWFGVDSYRTSLELEKLSLLSEKKKWQIEEYITPPESENIFQIIDIIVRGDTDCFKKIDQKIHNGLDPIYLMTMLANSFRQMLLLKKYYKNNLFNASKESGVPYFIARKYQKIIDSTSFWELKKLYQKLADYDYKLKTGKINARVALYLLLGKLSKVLQ